MGMGSGGKGSSTGIAQYIKNAQPSTPSQGGMGGKGKGGAQQQYQQPIQQTPYQPPVQQNAYAQQYYQPQFQPETFNNPYAQGGFGQQMNGYFPTQGFQGGMGGKGGQMGGYPQQGFQGGMGGKGGAQQTQEAMPGISQTPYQPPQQGGMGGKGGFENMIKNRPQNPYANQGSNGMGGMAGMDSSYDNGSTLMDFTRGPYIQPQNPHYQRGSMYQPQGGMGGKGGQMGYLRDMMRGQPSGLAALQPSTATTQAATPAPEQPYMGNYLS